MNNDWNAQRMKDFPARWVDFRQPNPGPAEAYRLGLPYLVSDETGCTYITRSLSELDRVTNRKDAA